MGAGKATGKKKDGGGGGAKQHKERQEGVGGGIWDRNKTNSNKKKEFDA